MSKSFVLSKSMHIRAFGHAQDERELRLHRAESIMGFGNAIVVCSLFQEHILVPLFAIKSNFN